MADHVSMMRTPKATREYIERIAKTVWDDGVKAGRSATDPEWYVWYMEGFLSELRRAAYILIDQMQAANDGKEERMKIKDLEFEEQSEPGARYISEELGRRRAERVRRGKWQAR